MELTEAALWLNTYFANFDYAILEAWHNFALATQGALTPFFEFVSLFADKGIFPVVLALLLIVIKPTRTIGIYVLVAIIIGALITNVFLKEFVARPRPYDQVPIFFEWWQYVGSHVETDLSFPSGHTTAAMATAMAVFLSSKKKHIAWIVFIGAALVGLSRLYLMVHYPTDVLGGALVGAVAGIAAYFFVTAVINQIAKRKQEQDPAKV